MLTNDEPDVDFSLALGADAFIDLASCKWKRTEDVFKLVGYRMVVFRRISNAAEEKNQLLQESITKWQQPTNTIQASIRVIQIPTLSNVSSSAVRSATDESILKEMLSRDVFDYIRQNRMYSLAETGDI